MTSIISNSRYNLKYFLNILLPYIYYQLMYKKYPEIVKKKGGIIRNNRIVTKLYSNGFEL